jgi:hypothetical protein
MTSSKILTLDLHHTTLPQPWAIHWIHIFRIVYRFRRLRLPYNRIFRPLPSPSFPLFYPILANQSHRLIAIADIRAAEDFAQEGMYFRLWWFPCCDPFRCFLSFPIEAPIRSRFFVIKVPIMPFFATDHTFKLVELVLFGVRGCGGDLVGVVEEAVGAGVGLAVGIFRHHRAGHEDVCECME